MANQRDLIEDTHRVPMTISNLNLNLFLNKHKKISKGKNLSNLNLDVLFDNLTHQGLTND
jgi:hypothetical protein